jgi:hypothetical protein
VASAISGLVVVFPVVSAGLALITQDAWAAIARGGLILAIAIAATVSVATRSPLTRSLARPDEAYRRPPVLRAMRLGAGRSRSVGPARRRAGTLTAAGPP